MDTKPLGCLLSLCGPVILVIGLIIDDSIAWLAIGISLTLLGITYLVVTK